MQTIEQPLQVIEEKPLDVGVTHSLGTTFIEIVFVGSDVSCDPAQSEATGEKPH